MNSDSNKKLVLDFYKNVIGERKSELIDAYISSNYIQHSASMKDGTAGLRDAIDYLKQLPKPEITKSPIVLAIADSELVMLLLDLNFMGKRLAVVDLFKVVDGKIVEHWDAMQDIPSGEIVIPGFKIDEKATLIHADLKLIGGHMESMAATTHRVVREGNVVGVQAESEKSGKRFAAYHLLKIVGTKIVESWTVEQEIPDSMQHKNGML